MRRAVILMVGVAAGLPAEIAGTPTPPRPGPLPNAWLSWTNDALSGEIGENTDDFRTSAFEFQTRLRHRILVCLDHSTLTDKQEHHPTDRADEATASVGWLLLPDGANRVGDPWLAVGGGLRFYGDLGGEWVQNHWHHAISIDEVNYLDYDDHDLVGLGYLAGGWVLPLVAIPDTPFLQRGQLALATSGQGAVTSAGLVQGTIETALTALGQDGAAWIGLRLTRETGEQQGLTATVVADHEDGWWATYGASVGGWFIAGAIEPDSKAATGRVGWQWQRWPGRSDGGSRALMAGELTVLPGPSLGATLRWQPLWLSGGPLGHHAWITGTYRFGRTGVAWDDNVVVYDQATAGIEFTGGPAGAGFHWEPYADAGLGGRAERVVVRGDVPRYEPDRIITGVAAGAVGLRAVWGPDPAGERTARYGLGLGLEGWLPFQSRRIDNGTQSDRYNLPGWTIGGSVTVLAQW
jgi:hypothetical protein